MGIVMGWDHSFDPAAIYWATVVLVALFYTVVACYRLRFELIGAANQTVERTGAPPLSSVPE